MWIAFLLLIFLLFLCTLFGCTIHLRWPLLISTLRSLLKFFLCKFVSDSHSGLCIGIPFLYFQFHYYVYCTFGTELRIHTPTTDRNYCFSVGINCIATKIGKITQDMFEEWKVMSGVFHTPTVRQSKNYQKESSS